MEIRTNYFYGNEVSDYGKENKRVDYQTLAKAFDAVLSNDIISQTESVGLGFWELENGSFEYYEDSDGNVLMPDEAEERVEELEEKKSELEDNLYDLDEDDPDDKIEIDKLQEQIDTLEKEIDKLTDTLYNEVFQYYIISDSGANLLEHWTNEIVWHNEELDMYVWGVTHWGTSWDYVLTDIVINTEEEE